MVVLKTTRQFILDDMKKVIQLEMETNGMEWDKDG
jgi:hypothetical protein